jgi:hypothetical protein
VSDLARPDEPRGGPVLAIIIAPDVSSPKTSDRTPAAAEVPSRGVSGCGERRGTRSSARMRPEVGSRTPSTITRAPTRIPASATAAVISMV